jgi:hypothetical protein
MRFLRKLRMCSALSGVVVMALLLLPIILLQILTSRPDYENEGRTMPWVKGDHIRREEVAIKLPEDVKTLKISICTFHVRKNNNISSYPLHIHFISISYPLHIHSISTSYPLHIHISPHIHSISTHFYHSIIAAGCMI